MAEVGSATATILFTDLVGSTELRSRLGEEAADELRRVHDRLLGEAVAASHGRVVKSLGDGILAAFHAAAEALSAAVAIQQAAHAYSGRADALALLRVRVGISAGDVSWEDGDCFGAPVVEAARLEAVAEPGQILCAELVRLLARGRGGFEFEPLGFLELKGLAEPLAACAVRWAPAQVESRWTPPLPLALGADPNPLVGRARELDATRGLAAAATPSVLWLFGEPGIGKTRLAAELARRAHHEGALVLFGRCSAELTVPYQPFGEALRALVAEAPDDVLARLLGDAPGELTRLAPELAGRLGGLAPPTSTGSEADRLALYDAVASWLAASAAHAPVVFVLDDLHWAADATLALAGHVLRRPCEAALTFLVTARDTSPDANAGLARLHDELTRSAASRSLTLTGLDEGAVAELCGRNMDAGELHRRTAGNPLFVNVLARSADHEGLVDVAGAVRRRLDGLDPETRSLLVLAAPLGLELDLRVASAASGADELDTLERLEAAAAAGLLTSAGANQFRWVHALVRDVLLAEPTEARRARVHHRLAAALERVHAGDLPAHAAELAHHLWEAREVADRAAVAASQAAAARVARQQLSFAEAAAAFARALEAGPAAELRPRLLLEQGEALGLSGDYFAALTPLGAAQDAALEQGDVETALDAAVRFEETCWYRGLASPQAVVRLRRALEAGGDAPARLRARALASLGRVLGADPDSAEAPRIAELAVAEARRSGDRLALARAMLSHALVAAISGRTAEFYVQALEAERLVRDDDEPDILAETLNFASYAHAALGDPVAWRAVNARATASRSVQAVPFWRGTYLLQESCWALAEGRLAAAAELLADAQAALGRGVSMEVDGVFAVREFVLRREQATVGELLGPLRTLLRLMPDRAGLWRPGLAALCAELGLHEEARAQLDALAADDWAALPRDGGRYMSQSLLVDVVCALGDLGAARRLHGGLLPLRGSALDWFGSGGFLVGAADRSLGMLEGVLGEHARADESFAAAVEFDERMGWTLWLAHDWYEWGRARRRRGELDASADCFARAAALADTAGLPGLHAKLRAAAR
ncbi:MAG: ATP-binding protein [Acidimicrobiales bacterium]